MATDWMVKIKSMTNTMIKAKNIRASDGTV